MGAHEACMSDRRTQGDSSGSSRIVYGVHGQHIRFLVNPEDPTRGIPSLYSYDETLVSYPSDTGKRELLRQRPPVGHRGQLGGAPGEELPVEQGRQGPTNARGHGRLPRLPRQEVRPPHRWPAGGACASHYVRFGKTCPGRNFNNFDRPAQTLKHGGMCGIRKYPRDTTRPIEVTPGAPFTNSAITLTLHPLRCTTAGSSFQQLPES
eukprot:116333-Prorocentrum_minimum.AAC.1